MGSLSGSTVANSGVVNLSSPTQTDWIQFPSSVTPNRRSGGGSTITVPTAVGSTTFTGYSGDAVGITWADGTPTANATASGNGIYASNSGAIGQGMQFMVPADTTVRKVVIAWSSFAAAAQIVATLSDGSATAVTHTPIGPTGSTVADYLTTLTYAANSAGQTLTLAMTLAASGASANISLQAASYIGILGMDPNLFTGMGISATQAQEIAAQVTAGVGNADRLRGTGMSAQAATLVAAQISALITDPIILSGFD